jgi:hypothetical protein
MAGTSGMYGGEKCMQGLVEKPQGKRPLRRHEVNGRIISEWTFKI